MLVSAVFVVHVWKISAKQGALTNRTRATASFLRNWVQSPTPNRPVSRWASGPIYGLIEPHFSFHGAVSVTR